MSRRLLGTLLVPAVAVGGLGAFATPAHADDGTIGTSSVCVDSARGSESADAVQSELDSDTYSDSTDSTSPSYTTIYNKNKEAYVSNTTRRVVGDRGITLRITVGESVTWSFDASVTLGADAGVIFANASTSLSVGVERSQESQVTVEGEWTVPQSQAHGTLEAGATGVSFSFQKYHYKSPCTKVIERSGTVTAPTKKSIVWYHHY